MTIQSPHNALATTLTIALLTLCVAIPAQAELTFQASWKPTNYDDARAQIVEWLDNAALPDEIDQQARELWPVAMLQEQDGSVLLDRAVATFALADQRAKALQEACNTVFTGPTPPDSTWLADDSLPELLVNNMRLYYARWLAQRNMYDEVVAALADLHPDDVLDPAGLLFYQTVAYHQLVDPESSRLRLARLLEQEELLPRRYLQVAQLLERDLAGLKDDSLDHVARRMNDVRRRLDIGRAGKQVQVIEKGVVDSLDRLIKKLEQQQQQQQQQLGQAGGAPRSSQPMQDSQLPSMPKQPMKVDNRDIGNQAGWGDLPAKQREQALQQIGREYPAYYRELIEQYFRELADESNEATPR